jgi:hypothetical protein
MSQVEYQGKHQQRQRQCDVGNEECTDCPFATHVEQPHQGKASHRECSQYAQTSAPEKPLKGPAHDKEDDHAGDAQD